MDIEKCFEILEIDKDRSPEKVKEAYRDIINVWHPDRFSNNLRLKEKAESKVKEINMAFDTVQSHMLARQQQSPQEKTEPGSDPAASKNAEEREKASQRHWQTRETKTHKASGKKYKHKDKHKHKDKSRSGKHGHHR